MNTIHTVTQGNKTLYKASDVFNAIGAYWGGKSSLNGFTKNHFTSVTGPVKSAGGKVSTNCFYALTEKGVEKLCKKHDVTNPLITSVLSSTEQVQTNSEVEKLKREMAALKSVFAATLTKTLQNQPGEIRIIDPNHRVQIRNLVGNFAKTKAAELNVTRTADMGIFYDLSFKKLYDTYKQERDFDIKSAADDQGISGLQLAEEYGIIDDLLEVATELFAE